MPTPLIGITTYRSNNEYGLTILAIAEAYVAALAAAGASPVLIPLGLPETHLRELVERLDGVLFTGGGDIHPEHYNGKEQHLSAGIDPDRDRVEFQLFQEVTQERLPFLGICRGLQVINVALGGSLYEDILVQAPGALRHQYFPEWPRHHLAHRVEVDAQSTLRHILGTDVVQVNSLHHQGIHQLAPGLTAVAHAPDGIIEAVEAPEYPFGMAVQWHPENLQEHAAMRALFRAFVKAAGQRKK